MTRPASNVPHLYLNFSSSMLIKLYAEVILHHSSTGTYPLLVKRIKTPAEGTKKKEEDTYIHLLNGTR